MSKILYKIEQDKIAKAECVIAKNKVESITSVKSRTGCDIVVNTAVFEFGSGQIGSRVDVLNHRYGNYGAWGIGFKNGITPMWDYDNGQKSDYFVGAYSHLVNDGKINDGLKNNARRGRTAIGITRNNDIVIYVCTENSSDSCTTNSLANIMINAGCINAINLDGSYSSQIICPNGKIVTSRSVAAFLCIWLKHDNTEGDKETMNVICTRRTETYDVYCRKENGRYIDIGDKCVINTKITEGLFVEITYPAGKVMRKAYIKDLGNFTRA